MRATLDSTRAGRPPKFNEPSGPVTVTLPDRTLEQLRRIDDDRARAIVKAVDAFAGHQAATPEETVVVEMAQGTGILVVPANRSLLTIPWLKMIEIAPGRYLLTTLPGTPIEKIELALLDVLEEARQSMPQEVPMLESLRAQMGRLRRGNRISRAEILFVDV